LGTRRKSREIAIQILNQFEMNRTDLEEGLKLFWAEHPNSKEVSGFAEYLVRGVDDNKEEIDSIIVNAASNWSLKRISPVDRGILREAIFEFIFCEDIPYKVTLNEAIEMGKKFSSEKSGSFINGILDSVVEKKPDLKKKV
jgi:N utilization substance protein B